MSVHYRKGPDHHWMTLLRATKPNWSRPPAANGPERNSPGWVMSVFSALFLRPLGALVPPPPHPSGHQPCYLPVPLHPTHAPHRPSLLVSFTLTHTSTQCCWSQCLSVCCTWQQMLQTDPSEGIRGPYVWMSHGPPAFPTQFSWMEESLSKGHLDFYYTESVPSNRLNWFICRKTPNIFRVSPAILTKMT